MAEVPDLLEDGSVAATAEVGDRASLRLKRALDLGERVRRLVRREDTRAAEEGALEVDKTSILHEYLRSKHVVGGVHLERADDGVEEVNHILVLLVVRAVAGDVERGRASGVLGELVRPESLVGLALADPVLVHCTVRAESLDGTRNASTY